MEALVANATFIGRSFAGDAKQVKELLKAALAHNGIAVLDIISPCVTFNDDDTTFHSYAWGKEHEEPLHDITYVPPRQEIMLDKELAAGEIREVTLHDGSVIVLKNLERSYDPTSRFEAMRVMEEAERNNWLITGLLYIDTTKHTLTDVYELVDEPLNRLGEADLRPAPASIQKVNDLMF